MPLKLILTSWAILFVAAFAMVRCSTDPGSTSSIGGAGVFNWESGDADVIANKVGGEIKVAVVLYGPNGDGNREIASLIADDVDPTFPTDTGIAFTFTPPVGRSKRECDVTYTFVGSVDYGTYIIYTFQTSSTCDVSVSTSVIATNTLTGETRVIGAEGTTTEGEGGTGSSAITHHTAFVTSGTTNGNIGGLGGADALCTSVASTGSVTSSLVGSWKAIMSSQTISAASRLPLTSMEILNTNGEQVKTSALDLFNGALTNKINYNQNGVLVASGGVWTGTLATGGIVSGRNCTSWTYDGTRVILPATQGNLNSLTVWLNSTTANCSILLRVYCMLF